MSTWLLLWASAWAASPSCEPLDEAGFRDLLLQLQAGIDRGDLALSGEIVAEVRREVPCFDFAPRPRQWAAYLVGESIVRFARGEAWEPTMASALRLYPAVERGVSSRHPLASWEPPAGAEPGASVTRDGLFVDGLPAEALPGEGEVHLVQRTDGRFWNSVLVEPEAPLPSGWATSPVEQPPRLISFLAIDGGAGVASVLQVPDFETDWVQTIEPSTRTAASVAVDGQGAVTFYSPFGLYARGTIWLWGASPGLDAHAAAIWTYRGLMVGAGGGATSLDELQGPRRGTPLATALPESSETHRVHMPRYALGTVHLRGGRGMRWHTGLTLGGGASVAHGVLEAHLSQRSTPDRVGAWRGGLTIAFSRGQLAEQRRPDNQLDVGSSRVALTFGRVWGEY